MNIKELMRLTEVSVQSITAEELQVLFKVLTEQESLLLAKIIRNNAKLDAQSYYEMIGKALEVIVYRLTQENIVKVVFNHEV